MISTGTLLEIIQILGLGIFVLLGMIWKKLDEYNLAKEKEESIFFVLFILVIGIMAFSYVCMMRLAHHGFIY